MSSRSYIRIVTGAAVALSTCFGAVSLAPAALAAPTAVQQESASQVASQNAAAPQCNISERADTTTIYQYAPASSSQVVNSHSCTMGQGAQSAAVRALQNALNQCYSAGITADGIFGAGTRRALINAQSRLGAVQDGVYGPNTAERMSFYSYNRSNNAGVGCKDIDLRIYENAS